MKGKVFLVHWREAEAEVLAKEIRTMGWDVAVETGDGARAGRRIRQDPPDAVVIYLTRLPSHGREAGQSIKAIKAIRKIPLVFVDGMDEAVDRTRARVPDAIYTTTEDLARVLMDFSHYGH